MVLRGTTQIIYWVASLMPGSACGYQTHVSETVPFFTLLIERKPASPPCVRTKTSVRRNKTVLSVLVSEFERN